VFERRERDLHVRGRRSDDADEVDVVAFNQLLPIRGDVWNAELMRDCFGAFATAARNGDDFRAHAIAKAWDLSRARKPRPDDTDSYRRFLHGPLLYRISRRISH